MNILILFGTRARLPFDLGIYVWFLLVPAANWVRRDAVMSAVVWEENCITILLLAGVIAFAIDRKQRLHNSEVLIRRSEGG